MKWEIYVTCEQIRKRLESFQLYNYTFSISIYIHVYNIKINYTCIANSGIPSKITFIVVTLSTVNGSACANYEFMMEYENCA